MTDYPNPNVWLIQDMVNDLAKEQEEKDEYTTKRHNLPFFSKNGDVIQYLTINQRVGYEVEGWEYLDPGVPVFELIRDLLNSIPEKIMIIYFDYKDGYMHYAPGNSLTHRYYQFQVFAKYVITIQTLVDLYTPG